MLVTIVTGVAASYRHQNWYQFIVSRQEGVYGLKFLHKLCYICL